MPRINKIKRGRAVLALTQAGMAHSTAERYVRMLDLDAPLKDQIIALAEDLPDLFGDDTEDDGDDKPMTAREATAARLRGGSEHIARKTFRRPAEERPSTAPATAQEAAAHLRKNSTRNTPPAQQWREPVRNINDGHASAPARPAHSSADRLAARLKG
ncbi:hypothetical protein AB0911_31305 [Streptomyces nigra]|uniref:hypothetical protein n=1 Tax=Streptomyces nigra TaxID=1827580 RepID=UPI0034520CB8